MDLLCLGDNIVDRYVDERVACPGGNCVNVAVHAARAGATVAYAGSVGDDAEGRWLTESVAQEGVDATRVLVGPGRTGYADIHRENGERHFGDFDRGASRLVPSEEWLRLLPTSGIVHTSYSSGLEELLPGLRWLGQRSFDFDVHLDDDYRDAHLPHVEHAWFSGSDRSLDQAIAVVEDLLRRGLHTVTVTRGSEGAVHASRRGVTVVAARPIAPVDTLGAGDAFIGTALAGIAQGHVPDLYLERAAIAAAGVCGTLGGFGHPQRIVDPLPHN